MTLLDLSSLGTKTMLYLHLDDIPINCSVYSLTSGMLHILEYANLTTNLTEWLNLTTDNYLPAYYVTNCSIPQLVDLVTNLTVTDNVPPSVRSRYTEKDNGDTFIALLFTLCGTCVSGWMLSLMLYLSPKHKRKPWLAQLATIFYSIVTTMMLSRFTTAALKEYYEASLDLIYLIDSLRNNTAFKVAPVLSQVFTHLAWFQIILKTARHKYKTYIALVGGVLILACAAVQTYYQVMFINPYEIFNMLKQMHAWKIARYSLEWFILLFFAGNILYYTTIIKNPRKVCYSRRLLPLAIFNWILFAIGLILSILYLSYFTHRWLVRAWIVLIPCMIDIVLITTIWEWIFNIWVIEKKIELMGVLGRQIDVDEAMSLQLDRNDRILQPVLKFWSRFDGIRGIPRVDEASLSEGKTMESSATGSEETHVLQHPVVLLAADEGTQASDPTIITRDEPGSLPLEFPLRSDEDEEREYDDEIVDGYDLWDQDEADEADYDLHLRSTAHLVRDVDLGDHIGSSSSQHVDGSFHHDNADDSPPPPFQPHPGFSIGDYWEDDKR